MYMNTLLGPADDTDFSFHELHIEPGGEIPLHIHEDHQEAVYVLSGRAKFVVEGNVVEAGPGFLTSAPKGCSLAIKNIGDETFIALAIFSPIFAYEDYLWPSDDRWPASQSPNESF